MTKFTFRALLILLAAFSVVHAPAQVIFYEDFDGIPGPTAGGAGTYAFPNGWYLRNVDNRTPDAQTAYVNDAWERREDFGLNVSDSVAFSNSFYSPTGSADDWMWTPLIGVLPANCVLSWDARAYDAAYPDGYEVRIMTSAQGPPTGGTGVMGNQLTNSTQLFTTAAEATTWATHTVNLNSYAGQSVYIGFRNNSNDKFVLVIDDVKVQVQVTVDAQMLFADTATPYTITPARQAAGLTFNGTIRNNGLNALSNVSAQVNVFNNTTNVYSANSTAVASLASGATTSWTIPSFTPTAPGNYTVQYIANQTSGTDQQHNNDTLYQYFVVSDTTYARDNGTVTGGLGIGAGVVGYMGQDFQINQSTLLTSVSVYVTRGYTGRKMAAVIWDMPSGTPSAIIGGTDTLLYPDDSADFYTIPVAAAGLALSPGRYAVTMIEFDSTLSIGLTQDIFSTNATWVNWPGNPFGTWANNEDFGSSFSKSYVIRPNFGCNAMMSVTSTNASCSGCTDGSATISVTNGSGNYAYSWSPSGGTGATENSLGAGIYSVTVTDNTSGCSSTSTVTVYACTLSTTADSTQASCSSCADGSATANVSGAQGSVTYLWSDGQMTQTASGLLPGTYSVTVTDSIGCTSTSSVVVDFTTGIGNLSNTMQVNVSPNPATDKFTYTINGNAGQETLVTMTNMLGETVYSRVLNGAGRNEVNLSGMAKGVYFFTVKTTNASKTIKVIVD